MEDGEEGAGREDRGRTDGGVAESGGKEGASKVSRMFTTERKKNMQTHPPGRDEAELRLVTDC